LIGEIEMMEGGMREGDTQQWQGRHFTIIQSNRPHYKRAVYVCALIHTHMHGVYS